MQGGVREMPELVRYEQDGAIARLTMDDGKVNVMTAAMLQALHAAFDRAEQERSVVILTGREKIFSAGFDLNVFARQDLPEVYEMMRLGSELALRLLGFSLPVVAACNGHALPMGAFLMLGSDARVGADGPFRIGLNEVAIKLTVPTFAVELARARLAPAYFNRIVTGEMLAPREAAAAGYLDEVVAADALQARAHAIATALTQIDLPSHAATKLRVRGAAIKAVRAAIEAEINIDAYRKRYEAERAQARTHDRVPASESA
jgi:enoyl-CoA hydratase